MNEDFYRKAFITFFLKGLIHFLIFILIAYGGMILLTGGQFHFSFVSISVFSYTMVYIMNHKIRHKTIEIKDKEAFKKNVALAIKNMHYSMEEHEKDLLIIKPKWHEKAYTAKLFIEVKEDEAEFIGVRQHIYAIHQSYSLMINNPEQETGRTVKEEINREG